MSICNLKWNCHLMGVIKIKLIISFKMPEIDQQKSGKNHKQKDLCAMICISLLHNKEKKKKKTI